MHKKSSPITNISSIRFFLFLIILLVLTTSIFTQDRIVYIIEIRQEIDGGTPSFVTQSLRDAEIAGADAIILDINTLGGLLEASVKVRDDILNSKIPTIAFINKRAISAGSLISLAADTIVMTPGATIGAATPVNFLGEKAPEKVISYWRAEMRATAEKNKRPVQIADAMVDEDVEIPGLIEKGKLLTLTTEEALRHGIADYQAENIKEVLQTIGLSGASVIMAPEEKGLLEAWLEPQIIWFVIGLILMILEFMIPGLITIFFGIGAWVVAAICLFANISLNLQLLIFIVVSIIFLASLRKWFQRIFAGKYGESPVGDDDADEFIGKKAMVTKKISPKQTGKVAFRGTYWDAEANEKIPEGAVVEIIDKKNITLFVKII